MKYVGGILVFFLLYSLLAFRWNRAKYMEKHNKEGLLRLQDGELYKAAIARGDNVTNWVYPNLDQLVPIQNLLPNPLIHLLGLSGWEKITNFE